LKDDIGCSEGESKKGTRPKGTAEGKEKDKVQGKIGQKMEDGRPFPMKKGSQFPRTQNEGQPL